MNRIKIYSLLVGMAAWGALFAYGVRAPYLTSDRLIFFQQWVLFPALIFLASIAGWWRGNVSGKALGRNFRERLMSGAVVIFGLVLLSFTISYSLSPVLAAISSVVPSQSTTQQYLVTGKSSLRSTGPKAYYHWYLTNASLQNYSVPLKISKFPIDEYAAGFHICLVGKTNLLGTVVSKVIPDKCTIESG